MTYSARRMFREKRGKNGGTIAEFGPVLFVFFIVILFPLISLFSFIYGAATVWFAATTAAHAASSGLTATIASNNAVNTVNSIVKGKLGGFANVEPIRRIVLAWQIKQIDITSGQVSNAVVPANTSKYIYEYQVTLDYNIKPMFYMGGPIPVSFTATSSVEHPEGLGN